MMRCMLLTAIVFCYYATYILAQGQMLIVGGGSEGSWSNTPYQWAVDQSGNKRVAIIGFSSATNWLPDYFESLGAVAAKNFQVNSVSAANQQALYDSLITYDVIFFRGGNQWNYYNNYQNTLLFEAVVDVFSSGGVVAGTSAGLAILSGIVFTAQNGSVLSVESLENLNNFYNTLAGDFFPFMPNFVFDSHFVERGRLGRLMGFMLKWMDDHDEVPTGIGVDDQTALTIDSNGLVTAHGTGTVTILRPDSTTFLGVNSFNQGQVYNLPMVQLSNGWSYNLHTSEVFPALSAEFTGTLNSLMQGYMQIWLTGSNTQMGNMVFISDFADEFPEQDKLLIISSNPGTVLPISNLFEQAGVQVSGILNLQELAQEAVVHPLVSSSKAYFFHGQAISDLPDFLSNSINGQTIVTLMQTAYHHGIFAGDMAAAAGHTMVLNYRTVNASYYGELEFGPGSGLLPFICIQPNVYESSSYVENTVSGLIEAMVTGSIPHGLWLDAGQYARFSVSIVPVEHVVMYLKGNYPVQYLNWTEAYTQKVPFFGGYDRNLFGISKMNYFWVNENWLPVGYAEPVTSTIYSPNKQSFSLYPSPASSHIRIESTGPSTYSGQVVITDLSGRNVYSGVAEGSAILDVSTFPPGTYTVSWNGLKKKFIKH